MRIEVDPDACVGAGQCVLTDPAVFDQGDDGTVALLTDRPADGEMDLVRDAVRICPGRALSLVERAGD